ncbi:unnamed protein product [Allacma fusca]|uniref:MOG interacting and ectopic P-granules protein 1 n=1 Tax=Allacma fusca TaxID=39272 RepID=A0A8J2JY83_9HEXA|nr:unnamed protein product [Allacma fusca]
MEDKNDRDEVEVLDEPESTDPDCETLEDEEEEGGKGKVENGKGGMLDGRNGDGGSDIEILEEEEEKGKTSKSKVEEDVIELESDSESPTKSNHDKSLDEEDVMEIPESDPFSEVTPPAKVTESPETEETKGEEGSTKDDQVTIVVNDTKSLVELANSKKEPGKEPTLVIIDTNAIMSGKGPLPLEKPSPAPTQSSSRSSVPASSGDSSSKYTNAFDIPDDAFLIEAPSFIVPYVFEQSGEKTLKETIKELKEVIRKEKEVQREKGEEVEEDEAPKVAVNSDNYFEGPVGKLLMNVGMNLVQEFVQTDLLKMQKRKAEKEKDKSRSRTVSMQTQQSIISLKKNLEESKENNEPFRHETKKCTFCNFKTESDLVMSAHLETPHMRNYSYRCNFCEYTTRIPHEILFHMEAEHMVMPRLERAPAYHQCPNCAFEDNSKAKLNRHLIGCTKRFKLEKNLEPPLDWDTPAKLPKLAKSRLAPPSSINPASFMAGAQPRNSTAPPFISIAPKFLPGGKMPMPPLLQAPKSKPVPGLIRTSPKMQPPAMSSHLQRGLLMRSGAGAGGTSGLGLSQSHIQLSNNQLLQQVVGGPLSVAGPAAGVGGFLSKLGLLPSSLGGPASSVVQKSASASQSLRNAKPSTQPSISITPLPRQTGSNSSATNQPKQPQGGAGKTSFVICEICDGYIKDLDQLRNHMQWIHKVKIHPKMIYNKPPLNCQKCQFRFFTDQGLERHLLGSHGLVTSSMQDAANKGQDSGRCPLCGKVYQWKLLAHVAKDHNVTLKPAHLSYKCTVCTATFGMYKLFESHVYSAHSMTAKKNERRPVPANNSSTSNTNRANQMQVTPRPMSSSVNQNSFKPMKINDEITIIPQPLANSNPSQRNKGSLTITPQGSTTSRRMMNNDDDGIQIIEIDDAPSKPSANGRNPKENGDFKGRLPISDSTLRKRNLEISLCGTDSDNNSADEFRGSAHKRLRSSNITIN